MAYVHPDADVRNAAHAANERLERWAVDLPFDLQVAAAVNELAATDEAAGLTGELARLLEFTRRDVRLAGHDLTPDAQAEVRAAMARLVEIGVRFNQHIAEVDDVLLVDEADLDGLPDDYRQGLSRDDDGRYRITMAYPDVLPFLEQASSRQRRLELSRLFNNRAADTNTALLAEAVAFRERVAELFDSAVVGAPHDGREDGPRPGDGRRVLRRSRAVADEDGAGRDRRDGRPPRRRRGRRRPPALGLALLRHTAAQDRVRRRPPRRRRLLPVAAGARRDARDHRRGLRARLPTAR